MQKRVVVADADAQFGSAVAAALREAGYEVQTMTSDVELVERIRACPPDLLIWSTRMEMDVFKRLDVWKPSSPLASIPQISIGTPAADADLSGYLDLVRDAPPLFMGRKPMEVSQVVEAATSILSRDRQEDDALAP